MTETMLSELVTHVRNAMVLRPHRCKVGVHGPFVELLALAIATLASPDISQRM